MAAACELVAHLAATGARPAQRGQPAHGPGACRSAGTSEQDRAGRGALNRCQASASWQSSRLLSCAIGSEPRAGC